MADKEKFLKMVLISGASHALKYKEKNPRASEGEVLKYVSSEAKIILKKIDKEI